MPDSNKSLDRAAPKLAAAQPKTGRAVLSLVKSIVLPILAAALGELLKKYGNDELADYLIPARDILNDAYPPSEA